MSRIHDHRTHYPFHTTTTQTTPNTITHTPRMPVVRTQRTSVGYRALPTIMALGCLLLACCAIVFAFPA